MGKMKEIVGKAPLVFTHIHVLHGVGVSDSYDCFIKYFNNILDEQAKTIVIPHRSIIREPWVTPGLIKSSRKCELL